jgi:hypothetical protein
LSENDLPVFTVFSVLKSGSQVDVWKSKKKFKDLELPSRLVRVSKKVALDDLNRQRLARLSNTRHGTAHKAERE